MGYSPWGGKEWDMTEYTMHILHFRTLVITLDPPS